MPKAALGIFIDGKRIFAARLAKNKSGVQIEALENYNLINSYEIIEDSALDDAAQKNKVLDPFGDAPTQTGDEQFDEDRIISSGDSNSDIIQRILAEMAPKNTSIAINIQVSREIYSAQHFPDSIKKFRLKKEIRAKLLLERQLDVATDNIGFIKRADSSHFIIGHTDPLDFTTDYLQIGEYLRKQSYRLSFIDAVEFALAYEINQHVPPQQSGHACVINFSDSYTLIFFMQNGELEYVIPAIDEGIESDKACQTALSRIMVEIDSGRIQPIDTIILTGEVSRHNAVNFFHEEMSEVTVIQYMPPSEEFVADFQGHETRATIFAPAIALARKALAGKKLELYNHNYLPSFVRDRQSIYNLGIPSYILLTLLFLSAFYLTTQFFKVQNLIRTENTRAKQLETTLVAMANTAATVDSLRAEIANLEKSTALIDSLTQGSVIWSNYLEQVSNAYSDVGEFAITTMENVGNEKITYDINLRDKHDVVRLERYLDECFVKSITESDGSKYLTVKYDCAVAPGVLKKE